MLQKNQSINYGGSWVFPGGVIEQQDFVAAAGVLEDDSLQNTARVTAARETAEEAGLTICPTSMIPFAHWVTPKIAPKRYAAWFLAADANDLGNDVVIDDGEIIAAQWFNPAMALDAHAQQSIKLNGPSFVTLTELSRCRNTSQALELYNNREVSYFEPRGLITDDSIITLYGEDSAYHLPEYDADTVLDSKAPLHRLYMPKKGRWQYVRHL